VQILFNNVLIQNIYYEKMQQIEKIKIDNSKFISIYREKLEREHEGLFPIIVKYPIIAL